MPFPQNFILLNVLSSLRKVLFAMAEEGLGWGRAL